MREAHVTIDSSDLGTMGLGDLISLYREAGIRDFEELACRGDGGIVRVAVETRVDEEALSALEYVEQWERVSESDGGEVYVVEFTAPRLPESLDDDMDDLVGTCDADVNEQGVTMSLVGPQDAISETVSEYETTGVSPDLRKLGGYEGNADPLDELTDRQREVVRAAYDMGYYEVPRETSTEEIATEFDADPSTVAEHLQRAERNLLSHHLE